MKKIVMILAVVLLLGGCSAKPEGETTTAAIIETEPVQVSQTEAAAAEDWGIVMRLENEKTGGAEVILDRSGSESSDELMCGSDYTLEKRVDGAWQPVPQKDPEMVVAWTAEAYMIPAGGEHRMTLDWSWMYGELESGQYRVGKSVMLFRGTGDYDTSFVYAEFAVID